MHTIVKIVSALLLTTVAACTSIIKSNPSSYSVEPAAVAQLRGLQTVTLNNAYETSTVVVIFQRQGSTWKTDLQQVSDTAIVMLGRAMENQDIRVASQADKAVSLRVRDVRGKVVGTALVMRARVDLVLEAGYPDGSKTSIIAGDISIHGPQRAIDGAILIALRDLLRNEQFVAYINH